MNSLDSNDSYWNENFGSGANDDDELGIYHLTGSIHRTRHHPNHLAPHRNSIIIPPNWLRIKSKIILTLGFHLQCCWSCETILHFRRLLHRNFVYSGANESVDNEGEKKLLAFFLFGLLWQCFVELPHRFQQIFDHLNYLIKSKKDLDLFP